MNEVLTSIRRTPYQSASAFLVLFLTLFLTVIILFSLGFLYGLLGYVETRPQVTVYFQTQTLESDIFKIRDDLISSGKVLSVKYVSKNDAFNLYKDLNKDNTLLLEMVTADILPASLEIYAKKPVYLPEIAEFLKKQPGVDEVNFQKVIIDRLISLTTIIRKTSFVFFGYLILMTIVILITIIHYKVALKKDEIELLKLLGASDFYIRKPFLLEGVFFGMGSAIMAFAVFAGIILYLDPFLSSYLRGISNLPLNFEVFQLNVWPINITLFSVLFVINLIFGVVISSFAGLIATQKYIK